MDDQFLSNNNHTAKAESAGLGIKDLFFKYVRFLPLFVISIALSLLTAYIYLRYTTPIYKSTGAIVVKEDNGTAAGGSGGSNDRFQQMFVMDNAINIKNEIEILRSRPLMKRVVEDLNLNYTFYVKGKIKESNIYTASPFRVEAFEIADSTAPFSLVINVVDKNSFRLGEGQKRYSFGQTFENDYGIFRLNHNPVAVLSDQYKVVWTPTEEVISDLGSKLMVVPYGGTGIIQLSLEADNSLLAADILNQLMKVYQVATREDKNETNKRMLEFIDDRMRGVERELDSITRRLLAYQRENNLIGTESQSGSYYSKIETADEEINELRFEDNMAQMLESYLRDQKNAYDLVPSTFGVKEGTLATIISAYNVAQLERKELIDANVPASNPRVRQVEDLIERLRTNAFESIRNARRVIAASIARLDQRSAIAKAQMSTLPIKEQNMMEIKTQQETKQTVYNLLLEKREQTAISLAGTISNMKVIEESRPNTVPVKPDRKQVYLISFVIGLALPALIVFGLEMLNDKVNGRSDIEKVTDVPIIGEVGHSFAKEPLVVKPNHRGVVAEQFRIVRSNLQYILANQQKPVILVTSSFSGEGKSFISTNLGAVMSLMNKKTIVLEFDIRKPKVLSHLGIPKKPGITNYLLGTVNLEDLPIPVPGYDNFYVLACGPIPPNPAELLLEPKLEELFAYLRREFDVVVIDTAPVGMVSDAMALSRFANSSLYIVRQGHTFKKQINLIDEFHTEGKLPRVSVILNDVKAQYGYGYYGYGRYGYGYGYGQKSGYFEDETAPPTFMNKWFGWLDMNKWEKKKKKENV